MHLSRLSLLATAALLACAQAYAFDVTVIPGPTSGGGWTGSTFTPTAAGATVNAGEVQARLASLETAAPTAPAPAPVAPELPRQEV